MLQEILKGFPGFEKNIAEIKDGEVTKTQDHTFTHAGGARDTSGANRYRVRDWVDSDGKTEKQKKTAKESGDSFSRNSSETKNKGRAGETKPGDFDYLDVWKSERSRIDSRREKAHQRRYRNNWSEVSENTSSRRSQRSRRSYDEESSTRRTRKRESDNEHWSARGPYGYATGGPAWRPRGSVNGLVNTIGGNVLNPFLFGYAASDTISGAFKGDLSTGIHASPHGLYWETTTHGYDQDSHYQYDDNYSRYGDSANSNRIDFHPVITVNPVISQNNPTNYSPGLPGYSTQFPFSSGF